MRLGGRRCTCNCARASKWAPGVVAGPDLGNDAGLLPLSVHQAVEASSHYAGREPMYAVDKHIRTWWQAAEDEAQPWLRVERGETFAVGAG